MKKIVSISIILIASIFISAFAVPQKWQTKKINKLYSVDIPDYLYDTNDLNSEASLQCENVDKEMYLIIIDEDKKEFIDAVNELLEDTQFTEDDILDVYAYLQFTTFATDEDFDNNLEYLEINGLKARQLDIVSYLEEYDIFYKLACFESSENLYFMVSWTTLENKNIYNPDLQNIINSFKVL
ncbi:MAG TPA: hypothetical protein PLO05_00190 [Bacteroidales bacterium]|jgi:hypothetical protein|nr:hypothetical protein [Bacteroidales bacterium]MDD4234537.1 hypothetical protein [Bacteroidales bacterium]MDY0160628.1 hypothetical protein [Bacteroidales bacterium]HRW21842.1 hypothetical protein [Bacteroidales bacterium]HXK80559.1 hypothetical protein [Bacteroidales bacterium]